MSSSGGNCLIAIVYECDVEVFLYTMQKADNCFPSEKLESTYLLFLNSHSLKS